MLALVVLAQEDSTGQRITLIVIGLLLAALMLAILTAWYYRVTDPGGRQGRSSGVGGSRAGGSSGGGQAGAGPKPSPGPGWRKRLSGMSVPPAGAKPSNSAKTASNPTKAQSTEAQTSKNTARSAAARSSEVPIPSPGQQTPAPEPGAPETVSLEGGYYLDLTDTPRSPEPTTNVGSLNALDLRQPAPLVDPADQVSVTSVPSVPSVPEPRVANEERPAGGPAAKDRGLSFDDWLAEVEATEDK